jgi:hypothetical protein
VPATCANKATVTEHAHKLWLLNLSHHHNVTVPRGSDIGCPGLLGAGVVVGLDLASLAGRAVLDPVARDAEVRVIRRDDDGWAGALAALIHKSIVARGSDSQPGPTQRTPRSSP